MLKIRRTLLFLFSLLCLLLPFSPSYAVPSSQFSAFEQWYKEVYQEEPSQSTIENPYAMINMYIYWNENIRYHQGKDIVNSQKDIKALQEQNKELEKQIQLLKYALIIIVISSVLLLIYTLYLGIRKDKRLQNNISE